jgi:hypothetical protein
MLWNATQNRRADGVVAGKKAKQKITHMHLLLRNLLLHQATVAMPQPSTAMHPVIA